ncbi:MAG TPA: hypothetical protein VFI47_20040 [Acidimicrobiales bacterium]|nr:hypothetical protein [Acidimicrobiales bacterium]
MEHRHHAPSLARALFGPATVPAPATPQHGRSRRRGRPAAVVREFYRDPVAWTGFGVCTLVLTYAGGAVMFWFHAIYLGEGGPAISPWMHWGLDSSAGFVGLSPAIALILPVAARVAGRRTDRAGPGAGLVPAGWFALAGGVLLALVTAPAPLLHDRYLARGTWLASRITELWGNGRPVLPEAPEEESVAGEMVTQVLAGIPTYVVLLWVALLAIRLAITLHRRWR